MSTVEFKKTKAANSPLHCRVSPDALELLRQMAAPNPRYGRLVESLIYREAGRREAEARSRKE